MLYKDNKYSPKHVELKGILAEFRCALEEEIDTIKKMDNLQLYCMLDEK